MDVQEPGLGFLGRGCPRLPLLSLDACYPYILSSPRILFRVLPGTRGGTCRKQGPPGVLFKPWLSYDQKSACFMGLPVMGVVVVAIHSQAVHQPPFGWIAGLYSRMEATRSVLEWLEGLEEKKSMITRLSSHMSYKKNRLHTHDVTV